MIYWIGFPLPADPISENQMTRAMFGKYRHGANMEIRNRAEAWKKAAWDAWKEQRTQKHAGGIAGQAAEVTVRIPFNVNRRRDPHNYIPTVKAIVDGLVLAGCWPDDTSEYVRVMEPILVVEPKADPRLPLMVKVEMKLREAEA